MMSYDSIEGFKTSLQEYCQYIFGTWSLSTRSGSYNVKKQIQISWSCHLSSKLSIKNNCQIDQLFTCPIKQIINTFTCQKII